jgi:outer membrane protein
MNRLLFFALLCVFSFSLQAQEEWPLERCIQHALDNNLNIKQAEISVDFAEVDQKQSKASRYPSLNASTNLNSNFGRTIDPISDAFTTQNFISSGLGLNTGVTIFNGFRISNSIKQSKIDKRATELDLDQSKRDIALSVANAYLSALFADENLAINESQLETSKEQLAQTEKLIAAGVRPANESLDILAQIATNEQMVIGAENSKVIALLNIKQLLNLDPDVIMVLQAPQNVNVESDPDLLTFNEVYNSALKNQPNVKAGDLRVESAIMSEKIAKAGLMPSLNGFASIGSNYSNQGRRITGVENVVNDETVVINGMDVTVGFPGVNVLFEDNPYFNQIDENLSYGAGVSLSIPIYNNYNVKANIERSKLGIINAQTQSDILRNQLKATVQQALVDAKAAKRKLNASERSVEAQQASFSNAEKRFNAGTINTFEYVTIKNALAQSEVNAVISKYEYLFSLKILDFYMGKPIKL